MGAFLLIFCIIFLVAYVYHSLALQTVATTTNTENPWFAWKKPVRWIFLFLIPLANVVIYVLLWMGIAEARNKPNWWGILMLAPPVSIIVPGYLAWSH